MPGRPSHARAPQVAASSGLEGAEAAPGQALDLLADEPVRQRASGVGPDVDRDPRVASGGDGVVAAGVEVEHVGVVAGELLLRGLGDRREGVDVDERRHDGDPLPGERLDRVRDQADGVLDAVGPGGREVDERLLAEAVGGDPRPLLVGGGDGLGEDVGGPARREVTGVAVDPVADELDPPVARPGLQAHPLDEVLGLDLPRVVADVAPGPRDVPAGADDARQVGAVVDPAGVRRRAGVADEEGAGLAVARAPGPRRSRGRRLRARRGRRGSGRRRAPAAPTRRCGSPRGRRSAARR